jgi:hypothetical protein
MGDVRRPSLKTLGVSLTPWVAPLYLHLPKHRLQTQLKSIATRIASTQLPA